MPKAFRGDQHKSKDMTKAMTEDYGVSPWSAEGSFKFSAQVQKMNINEKQCSESLNAPCKMPMALKGNFQPPRSTNNLESSNWRNVD